MRMILWVSLFLTCVGACFAAGQDPSPRPQNPDNWVLSTVSIGEEEAHRKEYELGPLFEWITVAAEYKRQWPNPTSTHWKRNGIEILNQDLLIPFSKSITESDTVTYSSIGTRKLKLKWRHPTALPPPQIRIYVDAYARYMHSGLSGSGSCDNGFNDSIWFTFDGPATYASSNGRHFIDLSVSNEGIAEMTLNQEAQASQSAGPGEIAGVHASASVVWGIDARRLEVNMGDQPVYEDNETEKDQTFPVAYTTRSETDALGWWNPIHHTKNYVYKKVDKVPAHITYFGTISNLAVWTIGVPEEQQRVYEGDAGTRYVPQTVADHRFVFTGHAAPPALVYSGQWYQWGEGPRVYQSQIGSTSKDLASPYLQTWCFEDWLGVVYRYVTIDKRPEESIELIQLTYDWGDGTQATSTRNVKFVHPVQDYKDFDEITDYHADGPEIPLVPWTEGSAANVVVTVPMWDKTAVSSAFGFGAAGFAVAGTYAVISPVTAGVGGAVAAVLGMVVENSPDGSYEKTIPRMEYVAHYVQTYLEGGELVRGQPPIGDLEEYAWSVKVRPKRKVQVVLSKVYGPQGFERQTARVDTREQYLHAAPRLYTFWWISTYPPGEGGGTGNGG